jgi:hypothetical protein
MKVKDSENNSRLEEAKQPLEKTGKKTDRRSIADLVSSDIGYVNVRWPGAPLLAWRSIVTSSPHNERQDLRNPDLPKTS